MGIDLRKFLTSVAATALLAGLAPQALAQDADEAEQIEPAPDAVETAAGTRIFTPADFARFSPRNALDMVQQVPGFTLRGEDGQRGLGQASANVLIDGARITNKSDGVFSQLQRIATDRVVRIEIVDGATLGIAGLSGQVANVVTRPSDISGRFSYRASYRPKYADPSFIGGEVSLSGSGEQLEWTVAISNGTGRGGAGGGTSFVEDPDGNIVENRDVEFKFVGDFPRVSGTVQYTTTGGAVFNANANYSRVYQDITETQFRDLVDGVDRSRLFSGVRRGYGYEFGGDAAFDLGPGRLKLIGLERFNRNTGPSDSITTFTDGRPDVGSRFDSQSESGERVGRGEYSWEMLGGDWQFDAEAAFNRLDRDAQLFDLDATGDFVQIPFPNASGGVTEDRYEAILTHSRSLADNLSIQAGAGGEYSTLSQTGASGLTRSFWRPKGSVNIAWQAMEGLDVSLEVARRVGQLSFGDFLASVSLQQGQQNAGNVELVPQQSWEATLDIRKDLGDWGSTELRLYGREIEDFIEFIPVEGGLETRGNIDSASVYGIRSNSTFQLEPVGFRGAQLNLTLDFDFTNLTDPLTGIDRKWSGNQDIEIDASLRHDVPGSDWAWGGGFEYNRTQPYYRLGEFGIDEEGPLYSFAFVEHKDIFGMTANLTVFNLTDGRARSDRFVYEGYRDRSPLLFREVQDLDIGPIFNFSLSGDF